MTTEPNKQLTDSAANLDAVVIVENLFNQLNQREQDILKRRFGLHGQEGQTLEEIGQIHKLTRERVRQILNSGVAKIHKLNDIKEVVGELQAMASQLLEEHGGFMDRDNLLTALALLTKEQLAGHKDQDSYKNYLYFLLSRILIEYFEEVTNSPYFHDFFKLKDFSAEHLEKLAAELLAQIQKLGHLVNTDDLLAMVKDSEVYQKNIHKFELTGKGDWSKLWQHLTTDSKLVGTHRPVYNFLEALSDITRNKFGQWGHASWRDVRPRTVNDKIYMVLKQEGKPMYYGDIAKRIQASGFDKKIVNVATTHNELILDDKYILVGRGVYGLREWGYKSGTIREIIEDALREAGKPLTKEEILVIVSKQRLTKGTTINLALMNKEKFVKVGSKYSLKV